MFAALLLGFAAGENSVANPFDVISPVIAIISLTKTERTLRYHVRTMNTVVLEFSHCHKSDRARTLYRARTRVTVFVDRDLDFRLKTVRIVRITCVLAMCTNVQAHKLSRISKY